MAMPTLQIREATPADVPTLAQLITELGYPTSADEMAVRFRAMQNEPNYQSFLAVAADETLGLIGLSKNLSWEKNGVYVRIIALVVHQSARKQGVGEQLIGAAEQWAVSVGANRLVLNCGNRPERQSAHRFYPKMGFSVVSSGYSKSLM